MRQHCPLLLGAVTFRVGQELAEYFLQPLGLSRKVVGPHAPDARLDPLAGERVRNAPVDLAHRTGGCVGLECLVLLVFESPRIATYTQQPRVLREPVVQG